MFDNRFVSNPVCFYTHSVTRRTPRSRRFLRCSTGLPALGGARHPSSSGGRGGRGGDACALLTPEQAALIRRNLNELTHALVALHSAPRPALTPLRADTPQQPYAVPSSPVPTRPNPRDASDPRVATQQFIALRYLERGKRISIHQRGLCNWAGTAHPV